MTQHYLENRQFGTNKQFDKYVFGGTEWDGGIELDEVNLKKLAGGKNVLVALSPKEYNVQAKNIQVIKTIYDHNDTAIFIIGRVR